MTDAVLITAIICATVFLVVLACLVQHYLLERRRKKVVHNNNDGWGKRAETVTHYGEPKERDA